MIGKRIVDQEQHGENRAAYGENILKELSRSLTGTFGKGFSYSNLYNFRQFYLTYTEHDKFYTLCRKLTWSHNRLIMRVENIEARNYYLIEAAEQNWSVRMLEHNIETFYYQRILSSGKLSNEIELNSTNLQQQPEDFIKDPYVFEFLNIPQPIDVKESEIESALIENLQQFLLETSRYSNIMRQGNQINHLLLTSCVIQSGRAFMRNTAITPARAKAYWKYCWNHNLLRGHLTQWVTRILHVENGRSTKRNIPNHRV